MKHSAPDASGRFLLRIDPGLHAALREAASEAGLSLNAFCATKLAMPTGSLGGGGVEAVRRAAALFNSDLIGVVAFGSWARGATAKTSDVDLLIVLEDSVEIARDLYRKWDEMPVYWDGHPVEAHFVQLPVSGERISGMWAEVATDGVILFERDLMVSKRLVQIREEIAAGRLVRRGVHGQPYWVEIEPDDERPEDCDAKP